MRLLHHLGPEMQQRCVEIFFGTMERGNPKLIESVMTDKEASTSALGRTSEDPEETLGRPSECNSNICIPQHRTQESI